MSDGKISKESDEVGVACGESARSGWGLWGECIKWARLVGSVHEVGVACEESG